MSWKLSALVAFALTAGVALAETSAGAGASSPSWDALRAAGFTAYTLLWLSTISGLVLRLRFRLPGLGPTRLLESHRILATLALAFVAGHLAGILVDPWTAIGPRDLALGFTSPYRPAAVLLGSIALWLMAVVLLSTAFAAFLHIATWRALHYLAFPAYLAALFHGLTAGTDAASPAARMLYASTAATVAALFALRVVDRRTVRRTMFLSPTGPASLPADE